MALTLPTKPSSAVLMCASCRVAIPTLTQNREDNRTVSNAALIAIVGPTAAGKSAVAMDVAHRLGAEIVNADAFCLYRGMDIGTAKPSAADQAAVVHHLLDTHDVEDDVDVVTYQVMARAAIEEIIGRGTTALLVGGSGLYVQAASMISGSRHRSPDPRRARGRTGGPRPSGVARAIEPHWTRRRQRSSCPPTVDGSCGRWKSMPWVSGSRPRWTSRNRGDRRCGSGGIRGSNRWTPPSRHGSTLCGRAGFVEEVRALAPRMGRTASRAVGYRQILEDPDAALEPTIIATRRLARRQRRWFRRDAGVQWAESSSRLRQILGRLET